MNSLIPYLLAFLSFLIAGIAHVKKPNNYWRASFESALIIMCISLMAVFFIVKPGASGGELAGLSGMYVILGGFYGLLVSLLLGYFLSVTGIIKKNLPNKG